MLTGLYPLVTGDQRQADGGQGERGRPGAVRCPQRRGNSRGTPGLGVGRPLGRRQSVGTGSTQTWRKLSGWLRCSLSHWRGVSSRGSTPWMRTWNLLDSPGGGREEEEEEEEERERRRAEGRREGRGEEKREGEKGGKRRRVGEREEERGGDEDRRGNRRREEGRREEIGEERREKKGGERGEEERGERGEENREEGEEKEG
ncbi:hypothetical protein NHX12_001911 [Muraenolepis orangiensis]|uniref:Uncharacterized protein n=1 Tax=Muraenolepis orangiensis TaxID=630683 RepID=A0A9Q0E1C2_9TELE|nr:hypothetical protein NHX12_001911 [Muraenolepis orangiensis]